MTQTAAEYRNYIELRYDGPIPQAALDKLARMQADEQAVYEATRSALMDVLETTGTLPTSDEEVGHDTNAFIASLQAKGFTVAKVAS